MKILAIRGHNLASIPEFELDLSQGLLADTRIFAITGPTGAGKSTLLDAMCLGLYDKAPRLFGSRDVPVGELGISALDPRSVMRRGASEAHAEVDFLGKDGHRFRAIWEVWRAHKKSDGKIQTQRMRLLALDSGRDVSGATKTETQKLIEEKIGLSFGEFRRAVLLAQGDFASFLRAKADERAELLERMTGTEVYAQLSRLAFARARVEEEKQKELETKRSHVQVLGDGEVVALREALERARAERVLLEDRLRAARAAVAWHTARLEMIADRDRATLELEKASASLSESASLRAEVERAREADTLRAQVEAQRALDRAVQRAESALEEAKTNDVFCRRHAAESFEAATVTTAELRRAEEQRERMQPELESAQKLDVQIEDARAHADEASSRSLAAKKIWRRAEDHLEMLLVELETAEEEERALQLWFHEHAGVKVLASQWPRWERELSRYAAAASGEVEAAEEEAACKERQAELVAELAALAKQQEELQRHRAEADALIDRAKAELDALRREAKPVDLKDAIERIGRELVSLEAMRSIGRETQRLAKLRIEAKKTAKLESELAEARAADAKQSRARKAEIVQKLEQAAVHLDLAARRSELLVDGEPCPLCGSTDHPAKADQPPDLQRGGRGEAPTSGQRAQLRDLEAQRRALEETISAAEEAASRSSQASLTAANRSGEIDSELESKKMEWVRRRSAMELIWIDSPLLAKRQINRIALSLPEAPKTMGGIKELDEAAAEMRAHAEHFRTLAEKDQKLADGLEAGRTAQDEIARQANGLAPRLAEADERRTELALRLSAVARERKIAADARAEAEASLVQPLADREGWKQLALDAEAFIGLLLREVEEWERNTARAIEQKRRVAELSQKTALTAAEAERARRDRAKADAARAEKLAKQTALQRRRRTLLSDRNVDEVQRELAEELQRAQGAMHEAESRQSLANQSLAAAEERLEHALDASREALSRRTQERERLDAAVEASAFEDLAQVESALMHGSDWLVQSQAVLDALKDELTRREAALAEKQSRLSAHDQIAVDGDRERAQRELEALESQHGALVDEIATLQGRLTADGIARRSLQDLLPAIAAQKWMLEQWSEMSALIGSADGKKFRTFAQGLTLDLLLDQANHHLHQLRPRYRLERVPGWDMELQVVDGDMGEEARPVGTLSGGETFLVSLSLALGLSTLSSKNVKIESLFIDEGFGHLDREALDVALSTLDQLQAEGRTIGLISHVPDIAERIGYQVRVEPKGPGRSEVRVVAR